MQGGKLTDILGSSELQHLLSIFNDLDIDKLGVISISKAREVFSTMALPLWTDGLVDRALLTVQQITFDEFLALLYEAEIENNCEKKGKGNYRIVQFLQLLEDYRAKCEQDGVYIQAERAFLKAEEIKEKEVRRRQEGFQERHQNRMLSLSTLEKDKMQEFHRAWEDYRREYQASVEVTIQRLKSKHLLEMEREEHKLRREFAVRPRHSKAFRQLKDQERALASCRSYQQAEKLRAACNLLQQEQRKETIQWQQARINQKTENLRKKQQNILMAHLKKIETTRDLHIKKQRIDAEKLTFKLKKLKHDVQQIEVVQLKKSLGRLKNNLAVHPSRRKAISLRRVMAEEQSTRGPTSREEPFRIRMKSFTRPRVSDVSMYQV